jgi:hypothetical protein
MKSRKQRLLDLLAGGVEKACLPPSGPIRFSAKLARLQEGK